MKKALAIILLLFCLFAVSALSTVTGRSSKITITEKTITPSLGSITIVFDISDKANPSMDIKIYDSKGIMITPPGTSAIITTLDSQNNIREMAVKKASTFLGYKSNSADDAKLLLGVFSSSTLVNLIVSSDSDVIAKAQFSLGMSTIYDAMMDASASYNKVPKVGNWGVAGYVFYDKGYYSDGWRFLEACPNIVKSVGGSFSVDEKNAWYDFGDAEFLFGFVYDLINKSFYSKISKEIGGGFTNSEMMKEVMVGSKYVKKTVYQSSKYMELTTITEYVMKAVSEVEYNGYSDWFLPSQNELNEIYKKLQKLFPKTTYWSSSFTRSEKGNNAEFVTINFENGKASSASTDNPQKYSIIVVRRF